ncbi:hypothetical protein I4991_03350 [Providencia stuartii]|nr:hypothetical protein [Providencia stuartii]
MTQSLIVRLIFGRVSLMTVFTYSII